MKRFATYIYCGMIMLLTACEDVVQIDLDESEPKLVIEASILWEKGSSGNTQNIIISKTSPFYESGRNAVDNAQVRLISSENEVFPFVSSGDGMYTATNFNPVINREYKLVVDYDGSLYEATEVLKSVVGLDSVVQSRAGGFSGEDYEIKAYYQDPAETEDFYLFKFKNELSNLEIYEDEFTNGNSIFGYYSDEDIEAGDEIGIQIQGISEDYYQYLYILRSQVGNNQGGPFETMPATVKGNIINKTQPENFPFGYFRLSEVDKLNYTVQ